MLFVARFPTQMAAVQKLLSAGEGVKPGRHKSRRPTRSKIQRGGLDTDKGINGRSSEYAKARH